MSVEEAATRAKQAITNRLIELTEETVRNSDNFISIDHSFRMSKKLLFKCACNIKDESDGNEILNSYKNYMNAEIRRLEDKIKNVEDRIERYDEKDTSSFLHVSLEYYKKEIEEAKSYLILEK